MDIVRGSKLQATEQGGAVVSTVKTRPNYYEMLGIPPSAPSDAIARAFAKATNVFRPHAFGGIAEVCLAYETLRDPARRRAYDELLGLTPKPDRPQRAIPVSASFVKRPAVAAQPRLAPPAAPQPRPAPRADSTQPSAESPSARVPFDRGARDGSTVGRPQPAPPDRQVPAAMSNPEPRIDGGWSLQHAFDQPLDVNASSIDWQRTKVMLGGLVAAAILVGALAGWWSGSEAAEPHQPKLAEPTVPPPEKAAPSFSELWSDQAPAGAAKAPPDRPRPNRQRRAVAPTPRVKRAVDAPRLASAQAEPQLIQPRQDLPDSGAADPLAPDAPSAAAAASGLPLPNRTVARTIERIGYACGNVASALPVEGEPAGVFKVTCTSGQSYQARPVKGRYRFRRWAKD